ncbi:unnamed protein product [Lactuca virosa]|uniref:Neutral/alkaline non-lysosomal ceramidase N-terminal domain-containing protein n=1 Tax=Lactuca virosa TaxID=75947 RepID=A0AAU9NAB2_9ASTR|nr:unnamed protein product [Lactuca virosa]
MTLLTFVDDEWGPVGSFKWFATHGTATSRTNSLISGDNKGTAARFMEDWYPDEFESTRIIGERQFRKATQLFESASEKLKGKVNYRHTYIDFSNLSVTVTAANGSSVKTCPAAMGFAFAAGTTDGPGAFDFKQGDEQQEDTILGRFLKIRRQMICLDLWKDEDHSDFVNPWLYFRIVLARRYILVEFYVWRYGFVLGRNNCELTPKSMLINQSEAIVSASDKGWKGYFEGSVHGL